MIPRLLGDLVFVPGDPPRQGAFALYGDGVTGDAVDLVGHTGAGVGVRAVPARTVRLVDALPALLEVREPASESVLAWALAARAALGLVTRARLLPAGTPAGYDAWTVGPFDVDDAAWLQSLADAFPPAAHALPQPGSDPVRLVAPEVLLRAFLDAVADTLTRAGGAGMFSAASPQHTGRVADWLEDLAHATAGQVRLGLRVELDESAGRVVLQVRSGADPSLVVDAVDLWQAPDAVAARFGADVETELLLGLRRAARAWPPLARLLEQSVPDELTLDDDLLVQLLGDATEALTGAAVEVLWPAELVRGGLRLRASSATAPAAVTAAGLTLSSLVEFDWQVTLGGQALTEAELDALAEAKRPLVRMRGTWVQVDPDLLARLRRRRPVQVTVGEALAAALSGELTVDGHTVDVHTAGPLADLADLLRTAPETVDVPVGLAATLRPYQLRGLAWLVHMCELGLGGVLADDMGLGKTLQVIALALARRPLQAGPTLVVCTTSLLGNWERELRRFAPDLPVRRYHADQRALTDLAPDEVVLTTYGTLRRDREALADVGWGLVVADEAQHVKNPYSTAARELRAVPAAARVALTGTPVENRLSDLWAIVDWTTPGLLGTLSTFRSTIAVPVERHRDPQAAARFAGLIRPFLLRRRKSDPDIAPELPPKTETDELVPLTPEQVTLYEATVREALAEIAAKDGIARQGLVLKLITALKQICNHPAQYLGQRSPLAGRSGKLTAFDDLIDVIVDENQSVLVFTQYVSMARLLAAHLADRGVDSLFLHGGVGARRREQMVAEFQAGQAPVFLLSLKAGGVGLNLTRASHVIHYDRWWNPAVEDQATDRAYRIGQDQPVQVHRLVTENTVEDRVATIIADKRALADSVVGSGEGWIGNLSDDDLAALVRLGTPR